MDEDKQQVLNLQKSSTRRYSSAIDRVVEDLTRLETPSPKLLTKKMTSNLRRIETISENIQKTDLNPFAFEANQEYKMTKDKIEAYINQTYNKSALKDDNRLTEILQNRPLTSYYKPSMKLLFNSVNETQIHELISINKRKFGEFWNITPKSNKNYFMELSQIEKRKSQSMSPKRSHLSSLITKLMVKNLGIKSFKKKENQIELHKNTFHNFSKFQKNIKNNKKHTEEKFDEIIIKDEKEYLWPEYAEYIKDVSNKIKIEKYIGKNSGKKRKMIQLSVKLSKL